jgi:hypothetical protein
MGVGLNDSEKNMVAYPYLEGLERWCGLKKCACELSTWACCPYGENERLDKSRIFRVSNGVADRVDRLKAIGNGQVPAVVRLAWEILSHG